MDLLREMFCLAGAASAVSLVGWVIHGTACPQSNFWGRVLSSGPRESGCISLTFDDGPSPDVSLRIMDILGEVGVKATFFVIGRNAQRWPEIVRRMDAEGHLVGNHSFDHAHYGLFGGPIYWRKQIERTDDVIAEIIGKKPALFRPPMGVTSAPIHWAARRSGHKVITWTLRAIDGVQAQTEGIMDRLLTPSRGGEIMVLHDGIDPHIHHPFDLDRKATVASIRPLISGLTERNLRIVRLDSLLGIEGYFE